MACIKQVPHERSLVERYQGRPVVFLGVNSDEEREIAQEAAARRGIVWRSWWDGAGGPIAAQWGIKFYPTIHVVDARGMVRFASISPADIEPAVEALLAEMH